MGDMVDESNDKAKDGTGRGHAAEKNSSKRDSVPGRNSVPGRDSVPGAADVKGKLWVRTSALIKGEPETLYGIWHNVETAPLWQEQVMSVTRTGEKTTHWVMQNANGTMEWESEIMADEPGRRIAWRSLCGDSENAGEVVFERAPAGRGTYVTVLQEFRMGKLASAWETVRGRNPKRAVVEDLRHFKALAETGENPRTHGQPHGPCGAVGAAKARAYAENIFTPPGQEQLAS